MLNKINSFYIKQVITDPERKSLVRMMMEAVLYTLKKRELPANYFGKFLYRKGAPDIDRYLSHKESKLIMKHPPFHRMEYTTLLRNKLAFALHMSNMGVTIPITYGYNTDRCFFDGENSETIQDTAELIDYFERLFAKNKLQRLFIKPSSLRGGYGCFMIEKEELEEVIKEKADLLFNDAFIFQQALVQHEAINKIHDNCINSIRFDSYIDQQNNYHILSAAMRFGAGKSVVDNASSGGFFVLIDMETGRLSNYGRRLMRFGGAVLDKHPDNGFKFGGYKIPYFEEAIELTYKAMKCIPDKIVGWDIAITQNGPVLIEGNDTNSFFASDIVTEGYKNNPIVLKILKEIKST